jgi:hypothetical protein
MRVPVPVAVNDHDCRRVGRWRNDANGGHSDENGQDDFLHWQPIKKRNWKFESLIS